MCLHNRLINGLIFDYKNYRWLMVNLVFQLIIFAIKALRINYIHLYDGIITDPHGKRWGFLQVGLKLIHMEMLEIRGHIWEQQGLYSTSKVVSHEDY